MGKFFQTYGYLVLLGLLIFTVFFPFYTGNYLLKWDILDIHLPWKFFISECLKMGILPLWNPYVDLGFPQMIDPGTWYPISWLIGFFAVYNHNSLLIELIIHYGIAASGMYFFIRTQFPHKTTAYIAAVVYVFSGFMVANTQHSGWIYGYAYLPYLFYVVRAIWKRPNFKNSIALAFLLWLFTTAAYPGFVIVSAYALLVYSIILLRHHPKSLRKSFSFLAVSLVLAASLLLPLATAVFLLKSAVNRGAALSGEILNFGSMPAKGIFSLFLGNAAAFDSKFYDGASHSLINIFVGSSSLILFLLNIKYSWKKSLPLFGIGLFFLLLSMGEDFPLRNAITYLLPFTDYFRFPAFIRGIAIFFLIWSFAAVWGRILNSGFNFPLWQSILLFLISLSGFFYLFLYDFDVTAFIVKINSLGIFSFFEHTNNQQLFDLNIFVLAIIFQILAIGTYFNFFGKAKIGIASVVTFEMLLFFAFQWPFCIAQPYPAPYFNAEINAASGFFPIPRNDLPVHYFSNQRLFKNPSPIGNNLSIIKKVPSADGYSPYALNTLNEWKNNSDWQEQSDENLLSCFGDSCDLHWQKFEPNTFEFLVDVPSETAIKLAHNQQSFFELQINNEAAEYRKMPFHLFIVPAGKHNVKIQFNPPFIHKAFVFSSFIAVFLFLLFLILHRKVYVYYLIAILVGLFISKMVQMALFEKPQNTQSRQITTNSKIFYNSLHASTLGGDTVLLNNKEKLIFEGVSALQPYMSDALLITGDYSSFIKDNHPSRGEKAYEVIGAAKQKKHLLSKEKPFSEVIAYQIKQEDIKQIKTFFLTAYFNDTISHKDVSTVIEIIRNGQRIYWTDKPLNLKGENKTLITAADAINLHFGDEVNAYVWLKTNRELALENMELIVLK